MVCLLQVSEVKLIQTWSPVQECPNALLSVFKPPTLRPKSQPYAIADSSINLRQVKSRDIEVLYRKKILESLKAILIIK